MGSAPISNQPPRTDTSTTPTGGPGGDTTTRPPEGGKPTDGANQPPHSHSEAEGPMPLQRSAPPPNLPLPGADKGLADLSAAPQPPKRT
jgi:hypothetical protein